MENGHDTFNFANLVAKDFRKDLYIVKYSYYTNSSMINSFSKDLFKDDLIVKVD